VLPLDHILASEGKHDFAGRGQADRFTARSRLVLRGRLRRRGRWIGRVSGLSARGACQHQEDGTERENPAAKAGGKGQQIRHAITQPTLGIQLNISASGSP
jgi:hypothetical protein